MTLQITPFLVSLCFVFCFFPLTKDFACCANNKTGVFILFTLVGRFFPFAEKTDVFTIGNTQEEIWSWFPRIVVYMSVFEFYLYTYQD